MKILFATALCALTISLLLFFRGARDPLGFTQREQIRSDAAVQIAQHEAQAKIEVAHYEAEADIQTARTWAGVLPVALLIVVGGVVAGIIFYYQGKAYLVRVEYVSQYGLLTPALPSGHQRKLAEYAQATNQHVDIIAGEYYLTDTQTGRRIKVLPKSR